MKLPKSQPMLSYNIVEAMHLEFQFRVASSIDLTWWGLPVSWLLRMMLFVAVGMGSEMRLSSCSFRQSLDARIAAAIVRVCLAVSNVV